MLDTAFFLVRSGQGGRGASTYRREKYMPKGGPDGGDGGNGGSVWVVAEPQENTLRTYQGRDLIEAKNGETGHKRQMHGSNSPDIEIPVPLGTTVWEVTNPDEHRRGEPAKKRKLGDVIRANDRLLVARGGLGGRGNVHFKSSTNRTPLEFEMGGAAEERWLLLELKVLADVGLVGFPNAGKSTLLSVISKARPKIANYPFTTITPNLGVMETQTASGWVRIVVADIPGLVEDASQGKGLGHQFLRHIERCRLLVYVLAPTEEMISWWGSDPTRAATELAAQYTTLKQELHQYHPDLGTRSSLVTLNKLDLLQPEAQDALVKALEKALPAVEKVFPLAAVSGLGLEDWKLAVTQQVQSLPAPADMDAPDDTTPIYRLERPANKPTLAYRPPLA